MKLMIIEDCVQLAKTYVKALGSEDCIVCHTYAEAADRCKDIFDAYLVDLHLDEGDGMDLCKYIRSFSNAPIIVITSDERESRELSGYTLGVDDYIIKPVRLKTLRQKIHRILERAGTAQICFTRGSCSLDTAKKQLLFHESVTLLTTLETAVLRCLLLDIHGYRSKQQLMNAVFDETGNSMNDATFSTRISELRKKLPLGLRLFGNRRTGYRLYEE